MKLYLQKRVEQWIAEHQGEITASQPRKQAAQKAVNTKRESAKAEIARLVRSLELEPIVSRASVRKEAVEFFRARYEDFNGEVTEKGQGYANKESKHVDEKRRADGMRTGIGAKKSEAVTIHADIA